MLTCAAFTSHYIRNGMKNQRKKRNFFSSFFSFVSSRPLHSSFRVRIIMHGSGFQLIFRRCVCNGLSVILSDMKLFYTTGTNFIIVHTNKHTWSILSTQSLAIHNKVARKKGFQLFIPLLVIAICFNFYFSFFVAHRAAQNL